MSLPLVSECRPGYVTCVHAADLRFVNSNGVLFGGDLAALLDDVTGHAAMTVLGRACRGAVTCCWKIS
jgi:acyl-CoA hydrolase